MPIIVSGEKLYTTYDINEKFKDAKRNTVTFQLILLQNYMTEQENISKFFENSSHILIEHTGLDAMQAFTKTYHRENLLSDYNLNYIAQEHFNCSTKLNKMESDYEMKYIYWDTDGTDCERNMGKRKREGEGKITADTLNCVCNYIRLLALETNDKDRLVLRYREGDTQSETIINFICTEYFKLREKVQCCPRCVKSTCEI